MIMCLGENQILNETHQKQFSIQTDATRSYEKFHILEDLFGYG